MSWAHVGVMVGIVVLWSGIFLAALKWVLDRSRDQFGVMFKSLEESTRNALARVESIEKDILRLKADQIERFVHRDDWIRHVAGFDAKLDALREAIERMREKLYERSGAPREGQT